MKDKDLLTKFKKIFLKCQDDESENRDLWKKDLRFANGDSDNGYQWDEALTRKRQIDKLPCLTINKIKQHNLQITNDAKKNRSSPKVVPVDGGADKDTAEIFNGIIRHIEAQSCADIAYATAFEFAVDAGLGYWRIITDYADEVSNDQEIYIEQIENPLNVYIYGNKKADGSDAKGAIVFEDMDVDDFKEKWPKAKVPEEEEDGIRIFEWFYIEEKNDSLIDVGGELILKSKLEAGQEGEEVRKVSVKSIKWKLIAGNDILESKEWPGKYIPMVRVIGEEKVIDGKVIRKSHTRGMKDAQRMYNFWTSSAAAHVAAQGKTPWIGAAESFAGYEAYWESANTDTRAFLPFNHKDTEGESLPMPSQASPPVMAQAYIQGMQIASDEMQAASGQYDAQLGENANQQSGRALNALQRKGDNATFHFTDSADNARRFTAMILIDLIPKIYDTARVVRMLGEDGVDDKAELDPEQQQAHTEQEDEKGEIKNIYNLGVGRYDVLAASGANYATKRAEAADGMIAMLQANPQMWQTHGDIIARSQDWPFSEEFAERSKKTMPPEFFADEEKGSEQMQLPPEAEQTLQQQEQLLQQQEQQIQQLDVTIQNMMKEMDSKAIDKNKVEIERYKAETDRLKAVYPSLSPAQAHAVTLQALDDLQTPDTIFEREEMLSGVIPNQPKPQPQEPMQEPEPQPEKEPEPPDPRIDDVMLTLDQFKQALQQIAQLASQAAKPRRATIEYDEQGNPTASVSYPIEE